MRYILLAWAIFGTAQAITYLPHTQTLNESSTEYSIDYSLFQPFGHANTDGEFVDLESGESFIQNESNLWAKYGFTPNLQLSAGLRYRVHQGTINNEAGEETSFSNFGFESYMFQVRYSFPRKEGWQYAMEGNYSQTTYNNDFVDSNLDGDTVVMGDDGQSVSAGLSASFMTESQNFLSGRFLFRNPSKELSSEIVTEAELAITWNSFSIYGGIEKVTSLKQDAYSEDPENKPAIATQSTYLFNSVNREWTAPYVGGVIRLGEKWRLEYRYINYLVGVSTDLGNKHLVTLYRRTGGVDMFKQFNQAFKEYTIEGTVQKLSKSSKSAIVNTGITNGLKKGMKVDFYYFDFLGGNELIASGYVIKAGANKSMVKITRRFSKRKVKEGTTIRAGLIKQ